MVVSVRGCLLVFDAAVVVFQTTVKQVVCQISDFFEVVIGVINHAFDSRAILQAAQTSIQHQICVDEIRLFLLDIAFERIRLTVVGNVRSETIPHREEQCTINIVQIVLDTHDVFSRAKLLICMKLDVLELVAVIIQPKR